MPPSSSRTRAVLASVLACLFVPVVSPAGYAQPKSDLDAFMEKVLARRELNRKTLNDYVLDEFEAFEILGPGRMPLHRTRREFTWYVRDGMHVRSPLRFDGVTVGEEARDEYERRWIGRERERRERKAKRETTVSVTGADVGPGGLSTEPRFVSEAYFMDFTFEPGNYLLAGREQLDGHDVLRIEYYPTRLFADRDEDGTDAEKAEGQETGGRNDQRRGRRDRRERERDDEIERRMNKTALVTLWVDPVEHQIVKYTFDNVWLDFLPAAWLVRVDALRAAMTMGQPFPGVWLPRDISISGGVTLANGSFDIALSRVFSGYREAQVTTTIKVPRVPDDAPGDGSAGPGRGPMLNDDPAQSSSGFVLSGQEPAPVEVIREVRVHGNAFLTDADVLGIAAVTVGSPLAAGSIAAIETRLRRSGLFETIEVRKRYRSLQDPSDVALVLLVHERPGVTSASAATDPVGGTLRRLRHQVMFLPILGYTDGYGFTYGARFSTVDWLGAGERLSLPLTWGGTKRAALEFERAFDRGPVTRITSSIGIWNRENPHFDVDEERFELKAGADRQILRLIRIGADASRSRVDFGDLGGDQWTLGAAATLDTRGDPAFPRNAVYAATGWSRLHLAAAPAINRYHADARGYLGVVGQTVLAGRAQYFTSDAALPPYEQLLLGGASTLRGSRPGAFAGDRMVVTSAELRVPITSVISGARLGLTVFADAGKIAAAGESLDAARWQRGAGGGLFLIASIVRINLDVARGFDNEDTRVHLASGFAF